MNNYFVKRTARSVLTLWAVVTVTYGMVRLLPSGPYERLYNQLVRQGIDPKTAREIVEAKRPVDANASVWEQYVNYTTDVAQGDLGESIYYDDQVSQMVADALPWTILVMTTATIIVFAIAMVLGAVMAYKEGSVLDTVMSGASILTSTLPFYVLGIGLVVYFAYWNRWFPTGGRVAYNVDPGLNAPFLFSALWHAFLPIVSVVITQFGLHALAMRGNSIQVLGEDYVRVARLRGLSDRRISVRYVARNAILPMYTAFLTVIGFNLSGSVILEQVFDYHGIGYYMFDALQRRDYPLMMGVFLVISATLVLSVYVADLTYGMIDPRVKSGGSSESY